MAKVYLAGPMRGIPYFNFPAFHKAAAYLRADGHEVFNPAQADIEHHGTDISEGNIEGCEDKAGIEHGLTKRDCFLRDTTYICKHAEVIALLPGWQNSLGAKAERALGEALGLEIIEL